MKSIIRIFNPNKYISEKVLEKTKYELISSNSYEVKYIIDKDIDVRYLSAREILNKCTVVYIRGGRTYKITNFKDINPFYNNNVVENGLISTDCPPDEVMDSISQNNFIEFCNIDEVINIYCDELSDITICTIVDKINDYDDPKYIETLYFENVDDFYEFQDSIDTYKHFDFLFRENIFFKFNREEYIFDKYLKRY